MKTPSARLIAAIRANGFRGPTAAWRAKRHILKISQALLMSNCNGNRPITLLTAERYAKAFGHSPSWYLFGEPASYLPNERTDVSLSPPQEHTLRLVISDLQTDPRWRPLGSESFADALIAAYRVAATTRRAVTASCDRNPVL